MQQNDTSAGTARRKQAQPKSRRALREIRLYQNSCHLLIRKASFARLVREILARCHVNGLEFKWQKAAIECLQESSEAYIVSFMSDAYLCSLHARRVTLMPRDFNLIKALRAS